jgi:hypothetical protein
MIGGSMQQAGNQAIQGRTVYVHACMAERPDLLERSLLPTVLQMRRTLATL